MALERFLNHYEPGPLLSQQISSEQKMMENNDPPVVFLLDGLIAESSQAVKAISDIHELNSTGENIDFLLKECPEDVTTTIFGNTLKCLMDFKQFGRFDHKALRERLNDSFRGTPIGGKFIKPDWLTDEIETVGLWKSAGINQRAESDPSLAFFFEDPRFMPAGLRQYLENFGILNYHGLPEIVAAWKKVANDAEPKKVARTKTPSQQKPLTEIEKEIEDLLKELKVSTVEGQLLENG